MVKTNSKLFWPTRRAFSTRILALALLFALFFSFYLYSSPSKAHELRSNLPNALTFGTKKKPHSTCTPEAWASGKWVPRSAPVTNLTRIRKAEDALAFAGYEGCAGTREFNWHLGSDRPEMWDRFPSVTSWEWKPPQPQCRDWNPMSGEKLVQDLVENGGWLLIGDSVTENHFFSLTCLLYPHVISTPNFTELVDYEHDWAQHMYLSPKSPLVNTLRFPPGFDIAVTPLVSFRRVDLLLCKDQLVSLQRERYGLKFGFNLFSGELTFTLPMSEYLHVFQRSLPYGNYATMIASTGGHWTTSLFAGYRDESKADSGYGIDRLMEFYKAAMVKWADEVQEALSRDVGTAGGRKKRQVVVRDYLPGHDDCHTHRGPWREDIRTKHSMYNWFYIKDLNRIFKGVVSSRSYPDITFLSIARPALLRPDAHATSDCLHLMSGSGVLEGMTHYISHFVNHQIVGGSR